VKDFEKRKAERVEAPHATTVEDQQKNRESEKDAGAEEYLVSPEELEHDGVAALDPGHFERRTRTSRTVPNLLDRHVL